MKISWGVKIAILYCSFVVLILILVTASMRTRSDLVSEDYYQQEVQFQKVIDASQNQSSLSAPVQLGAEADGIAIRFPSEFMARELNAHVLFYAPANSDWDQAFDLQTSDGRILIDRSRLHPTSYKVKISWKADGKDYFQESQLNLGRS